MKTINDYLSNNAYVKQDNQSAVMNALQVAVGDFPTGFGGPVVPVLTCGQAAPQAGH